MTKTEKRKLDILWSKYIRRKGYCELCGRTGKLDAHHIEGKPNLFLRYSVENGICLCVNCHRNGVHSTSSTIQSIKREAIMKLRGRELIDKLFIQRNIAGGFFDYEKKKSELENLIKESENEIY